MEVINGGLRSECQKYSAAMLEDEGTKNDFIEVSTYYSKARYGALLELYFPPSEHNRLWQLYEEREALDNEISSDSFVAYSEDTKNDGKLLFTLIENAIIENNNMITAPQEAAVSFTPDYTAKKFIACVNDANITGIDNGAYYTTANSDLKWKLWYRDDTTSGTEIALQREGNGFSFVSPKSTPITIYDMTYSTDGKQDQHSCPLPEKWENVNVTNQLSWTNQIKADDYNSGGHRDEGRAITTDSNGNIFVAGNTLGGMDGNTTQNGNGLSFLGKFSSDGTKLWIKQLSTTDSSVHSIIIDSSDNIYVSGLLGSDGMGGYANHSLYKFDQNGEVLWNNTVSMREEYQSNISFTQNGIIMLSTGYRQGLMLRKFSTSGELLWTKEEGEEGYDIGLRSSINDEHGNIYVLADKDEHTLYKFDSNGNKMSEIKLNFDESMYPKMMLLYENNFYIRVRKPVDGNYKDLLLKVDMQGNLQWTKEVSD